MYFVKKKKLQVRLEQKFDQKFILPFVKTLTITALERFCVTNNQGTFTSVKSSL